ncbi:sigma-70 family RNA polymerase sigma factor [Christensenellaceae bacterium OttesenSCG-928-L17]|nr:sigma-70 family RNA polymerase sigma factor [Christensenellaceae bacterium OttesenSCG-928-L17]
MQSAELMEFFLLHATQTELAEVALSITANREDAADILQDVAYMLVEKSERMGDVLLPLPYLKTCVRNAAKNWIKREARKFAMDPSTMEQVIPASRYDIDAEILGLMDWVRRGLADYPPERQEAFLKHYRDGHSLEMLEKEYGVAKNTLSKQFARMRSKLKSQNKLLFFVFMLYRHTI